MRGYPWLWAALAMAGGGAVAAACGGASQAAAPSGDDGGAGADGSPGCTPCASASDCTTSGWTCAKFAAASFCAPSCDTNAQCSSDSTCVATEGATGGNSGACVPRGGECGVNPTPVEDAGGDALAVCGSLVPPGQKAACACPPGRTCQPNGCRYNEYCDTSSKMCTPAPLGCGGNPGTGYDGGAPPMGSIGPSGGSVSRLYFGVVGDTRPANEDDTANYPTAVVTQIFEHIEALSPRPSFVVSTGDYQFANPAGSQAQAQLDLYQSARSKYSGQVFPTMGNHECTGFTASNCGMGNADGLTNNYTQYLQKFLAPIQQTLPYYEIDVTAADSSWTAKLLFVAANAWNQTQADWLAQAMSKSTTYTILVRHEPAGTSSTPGVIPAENIMATHPYTLSLVGHTHTYDHTASSREVLVGNGGAPLSGSKNYGFAMISQQSDRTLAVDMIDYETGLADPAFHFAVKPDGTPAP